MRLVPKAFGDFQCVDVEVIPPGSFVTGLMKLPVMSAAQGDGKLVADFEAECPRLCKF